MKTNTSYRGYYAIASHDTVIGIRMGRNSRDAGRRCSLIKACCRAVARDGSKNGQHTDTILQSARKQTIDVENENVQIFRFQQQQVVCTACTDFTPLNESCLNLLLPQKGIPHYFQVVLSPKTVSGARGVQTKRAT